MDSIEDSVLQRYGVRKIVQQKNASVYVTESWMLGTLRSVKYAACEKTFFLSINLRLLSQHLINNVFERLITVRNNSCQCDLKMNFIKNA